VVGDGPAVVVERPVEEPATTADVQHERDPAVVEHRPEGVEVGVGGRAVARRGRGHVDRGAAQVDRLGHQRDGAVGVGQRHERHREQAGVVLAEGGHRPVVGGAAGVEEVLVATHEHGGGERGEHQLALDAEQVEDPAPLGGVEGAHGAPALVDQQPLLRLGSRRIVVATAVGGGGGGVEHRREALHAPTPQPLAHRFLDERVEEPGQLHQVAVRVQRRAIAGVAHRSPSGDNV
jgi:hypothetical protein